MIFVFDQSAGYLLDLALYNKKGFVTAAHKLVLLTNFEILQNFPETDCLILPEFSEDAIRHLFTVIYDPSHRWLSSVVHIEN